VYPNLTSAPALKCVRLKSLRGFLDTCRRKVGVVTGAAGRGATPISLVDLANPTRRDHITTPEDPIEFLHDIHLPESPITLWN